MSRIKRWLFPDRCRSISPKGNGCTRTPHGTDDHWHSDGGGTITDIWAAEDQP